MNEKQLIHILVVEDDPSLQEGIRDLLEIGDVGYPVTVETAENGRVALEKLDQVIPDIIISDIMMPKMDGLAFLDAVRAEPQWVHIPFIFLTAKGNKHDVQLGRVGGADLYITKPFDSEELMDLVETQITRSIQRQSVRNKNMSKLKRSILQLINHEFRTPLTYVTAYYDMLAESLSLYEDAQNMDDYLKGIQSGCERLINLVEDLILVMDVRTGELRKAYDEQAKRVTNLSAIIQTAVDSLAEESEKHQVPVLANIPDLPPIWGEQSQLVTALTHLIENGIKFSVYKVRNGEELEVIVSAEHINDEIHIHIDDRGIGIPRHQQKEIFDIFYQYNREYYEQQGSGAGLVIVKGVADAHNGQILVTSQEDVGSRFTFVIPVASQSQSTFQVQAGDIQNRRSANVLIVEDDAPLLESLSDLLRIYWGPYKLNIQTAADGVEALEIVRKRPPDLIISDIMMPNLDGYELLKTIRENIEWLQIPFIFLSAKTEHKHVHRGLSLGAEEYIPKPYDSDELVALITIQLNRYFQLQQVSQQSFDTFKQDILNLLHPEFRVPLSSVNKYSQSLSDGLAGVNTSNELKDSLRAIQKGSQHISMLVEDFITLAELKTGETANSFATRAYPMSNLNFLLEEAYRKHKLSRVDQIKLILHLDNQPHPVLVDQTPFVHAFNRLFGVLLQLGAQNNGHNLYCYGRHLETHYQVAMWQDGKNFSPDLIEKIAQILDIKESEETLNLSEYAPSLKIASNLLEIHKCDLLFEGGLRPDGRFTPDSFMINLPYHIIKQPAP